MISDKSIRVFHQAVENIPSYSEFLQKNGFDPSKVKSPDDFSSIPVMNKKEYLQQHSRNSLISMRQLEKELWFCSTSGSTGEPYYFPRTDDIAARGARFAEAFLQYGSYGKNRTLVIICFAMGVWIGGVITLRSFEIAAHKHKLPVAFLPTGNLKQEVFKALKKLAPDFDQTIICGYPSFVKEIVDEASDEGINLEKLQTRLVFGAEAFTETFRDFVCAKAGVTNPLLDTLNIYGSADLGAMAYETPISIMIRRLALQNPTLFQSIFGQIEKTPTLAQYHPEFIEFEAVNGELFITSDNAIPLIRYAIGDHGGVLSYEQMQNLLLENGIDLEKAAQEAGILQTIHRRPFVFVYERTDLSASIRGIIVYPEFIKEGLLKPEVSEVFTHRFTMVTEFDEKQNQYLQINIELKKDVEPTRELELLAQTVIQDALIQKSSEFSDMIKKETLDQSDDENMIKVIFWPYGHQKYFAPGVKQKWVKQA